MLSRVRRRNLKKHRRERNANLMKQTVTKRTQKSGATTTELPVLADDSRSDHVGGGDEIMQKTKKRMRWERMPKGRCEDQGEKKRRTRCDRTAGQENQERDREELKNRQKRHERKTKTDEMDTEM